MWPALGIVGFCGIKRQMEAINRVYGWAGVCVLVFMYIPEGPGVY